MTRSFKPTMTGGRILEGEDEHGRYSIEWDVAGALKHATPSHHGQVLQDDTPFGKYRVEWDLFGRLITAHLEFDTPEIPDDYRPSRHKRGCCDPPDPSMRR